MSTNNPIIKIRLKQLMDQKTKLLKMKKKDRGSGLKSIQDTINRLTKWIENPETMIEALKEVKENFLIPSPLTKAGEKFKESTTNTPTNENPTNVYCDQQCPKTPENNEKPQPITDKWLEETPDAYKARFMDVRSAFRKMNGFG